MSMEFLVLVMYKHRQYGVAKQFNDIPAPPHDNWISNDNVNVNKLKKKENIRIHLKNTE